ncbi:MAG: hypothetical protein JSS83_05830 [Cyanobacteria bacterium SZAS LIN-3]|nr:hypothetical protein [Cyanobacteria bacterium SZAS LIN-3]
MQILQNILFGGLAAACSAAIMWFLSGVVGTLIMTNFFQWNYEVAFAKFSRSGALATLAVIGCLSIMLSLVGNSTVPLWAAFFAVSLYTAACTAALAVGFVVVAGVALFGRRLFGRK